MSQKYIPKIGIAPSREYLIYVTGAVAYFLLCSIPIVGFFISVGSMLIGFGATLLASIPEKKTPATKSK